MTGAPAFLLLFLSEGFVAGAEQEFIEHCRVVTAALLAIHPFDYARERIAVWACFKASVDDGIGPAPRDTAFRFHISATEGLLTRQPSRIVAALRDIAPIELGSGVTVLNPLNGGDIWVEAGTRDYRAVCVVARHADKAATVKFDYSEAELDPPDHVDADLETMLPFIAVSMWPRLPDSQPQYVNGDTASAGVLARELGALMGLGYESERAGPEFETYPGPGAPALSKPPQPNLTADRTIRRTNRTINLRGLKWRGLIPEGRLRQGAVEVDHPALPLSTDPPLEEVARYDPIMQKMRRWVVLLRHPVSADSPGNTSALIGVRYDTRGRLLINLPDPHLIEGGGGFRRGIYRPSVECLMRFEGRDVTTDAGRVRHITPYCDVCLSHVRTRLTGVDDIEFTGIRILRGPANSYGMTIASRLAAAVDSHIRDQPLQPVVDTGNGMICVEATVYRYETFFRNRAHWRRTRSINLSSWYTTRLKFPYGSATGLRTWKIWTTWPNDLRAFHAERVTPGRARPRLRLEYGLGAPGAIAYAGFGCIANRIRQVRRRVDGTDYLYHLAINLTDADLDWLPPGTILQIWQTEEGYRELVEYIAGIGPDRTDLDLETDPIVGGHSLYYMGRGTAVPVEYLVADQLRVTTTDHFADLLTGWQSAYRMRIAAQWYDAANVPKVKRGR